MFDLPIICLDGAPPAQGLLLWGRLFARGNRVSMVRAVESEGTSGAARIEIFEMARLFSPEANMTIRVGNPGEVLLRAAIEGGADLILLSASERSYRTIDFVLDQSEIPVLVVPFSANAAKLRKIVLALDGSLLSEMVMPIVKDMSRVHGSVFLLTRILGRSEIRHRNYSTVDKHLVDLASDLEGFGVDCKIVTGSGNTEDGIVRAVVEEGADMILMASHGVRGLKRSIFGTMAGKVIRRSSVPVLVAKAPALAAFAESQALPAVHLTPEQSYPGAPR